MTDRDRAKADKLRHTLNVLLNKHLGAENLPVR